MAAEQQQQHPRQNQPHAVQHYKGFVAGVFSGIAKLVVGHPFDTIKVRLQTTAPSTFSGPLACLAATVRNEGVRALYKGATPPLVGWMVMDSVALGSLTIYRRILATHFFPLPPPAAEEGVGDQSPNKKKTPKKGSTSSHRHFDHLPWWAHGIAGIGAGATVSMVAAPVEHIKARLQVQYGAAKASRFYAGPIDCLRRIYAAHGIRGVYHGLGATLLFRSSFFFWWGSYDIFSRALRARTSLSDPAINFWAGGLSAQVFWVISYPSDVVKQRIMTDPLGGSLADGSPRFRSWGEAARAVYREGGGWKGYWRGFVPCFLRAFPANAMALVAFEAALRVID